MTTTTVDENVPKKKIIICASLTYSGLFGPAQFVKCKRFLLELNSNGLYPASERGRKIRRHRFTSSIKRHIRWFHVVVM